MNVFKWLDNELEDLCRDVFLELFGGTLAGAPTRWVADGVYLLAKTLTGASVAAYGALRLPRLIDPTVRVKERLTDAFIQAGIHLTRERRDLGDGKMKPYRVFPTIERVTQNEQGISVSLKLPTGMDPAMIEQRSWVFQNVFGSTAKLINDGAGRYRLAVPVALPGTIPYSLEVAQKAMESAGGFALYVGESDGGSVAIDLQKQPHVGLVGVTGWGKSTALRCMLNSWLQTYSPDRLRLFLGDMKMSEFGMYRSVPHVEGKIAVRRAEVAAMLAEVHNILVYRQELFYEAGAIDQQEYEEMTGERLPFVVVCIDEVASLEGETAVHEVLEEIGQMGRSLGIFLILSQQRVDREVMDGKLKNNLNVRISYRMSDDMNSTMFLGTPDAAHINVKGRCYVKAALDMDEVQTPWISPQEARAQLDEVRRRYAGHKKKPLYVRVNPEITPEVELTKQESDELRRLVEELMNGEAAATCDNNVTKQS